MDQEERQRNYDIAAALLSEQNFSAAVIVGAVATVFAAVIYGIVVGRWNFSYGFAASGIGIVVGVSMQYVGRGIDTKFGVAAAVYTIAGCLLGNVFRIVSPLDVFRTNDFSQIAGQSVSFISGVDLIFWFVAVFAAVFLARRPLSRSDRLALGMYELRD
jgi:dipeptide/tripeptide permease